MSKIIKSFESRQEEIAVYERNALEVIHSGHAGNGEFVDPATILAEAREEAEKKVKEAYAEGMRRGLEAGEKKFRESVGGSEQMLHDAAGALKKARDEFIAALEPQLAELALRIAERILRRETQLSPDVAKESARAALEHVMGQENVVLHVNPDDLKVIREHRIAILEEFDGISHFDIVPDETVGPGGCIAKTDHLQVDARLEAQLEKVFDKFFD